MLLRAAASRSGLFDREVDGANLARDDKHKLYGHKSRLSYGKLKLYQIFVLLLSIRNHRHIFIALFKAFVNGSDPACPYKTLDLYCHSA